MLAVSTTSAPPLASRRCAAGSSMGSSGATEHGPDASTGWSDVGCSLTTGAGNDWKNQLIKSRAGCHHEASQNVEVGSESLDVGAAGDCGAGASSCPYPEN